MTEEISGIARALLGGECDCTPKCVDRSVSCAVCGEATTCLAFIWHSVKLWNRREHDEALRDNRRADFIRPSELGIACEGECTARLHATKHHEVQQEHATTIAYYQMLLVGKYNPESLAWLRKHGYAKRVTAYFAAEGNQSHG